MQESDISAKVRQSCFSDLNFRILDFKQQVSLVRESDTWLGYVLEKK